MPLSQEIKDSCKNPTTDTLKASCTCITGFENLERMVDQYETNSIKYTKDQSDYQTYLTALSNWNKKKSDESSRLENNQYNGPTKFINWANVLDSPWARLGLFLPACGGCGINDGNVTYTDVSKNWEYDDVFSCHDICKLTPDGLSIKLNQWVMSNPPPTEVVKPNQPSAPKGIDIQCCVNLMTNLNASNISNNTQSCKQTITNQISTAAEEAAKLNQPNTTTTTNEPTNNTPTQTNIPKQPTTKPPNNTTKPPTIILNTTNIIIGVVVVVFIICPLLYFLSKELFKEEEIVKINLN